MLSGSFTEGVQAMAKAAIEYTGVKEVNFAVVVFPKSDQEIVPLVIADFASSEAALITINNLKGLSNSGLEPSYDVRRAVAERTLGLSYTAGSTKLLFMWTDESGQTFRIPLVHEEAVTQIIQATDLTFVAFVPQMCADSFDDIALASGGSIHALTDATSMSQTIINYVDLGCEE